MRLFKRTLELEDAQAGRLRDYLLKVGQGMRRYLLLFVLLEDLEENWYAIDISCAPPECDSNGEIVKS